MKRILLLTGCLITLTCACFAQDVIVTKDAKKIKAKVTEVNVNDIKYKNFDNPDGPTYTLLKSDIASILYQNGQVEVFESEIQEHMKNGQIAHVKFNTKPPMIIGDPLLYREYRTGRRMKVFGLALTAVGTFSIVCGVAGLSNNYSEAGIPFTIGGVCFTAGGVYLFTVGYKKKRDAFTKYYSSKLSNPHFQLNLNDTGMGFAYVF